MLLGLRLHDDAHVWTIDIRQCPNLDNEMDRHGLKGQRYTKVTGDSVDVAKAWNVALDMLYVDGDHTYQRGKKDVEVWSPFVKPGGIIVLDDYENRHFGDVARFADELLLSCPEQWRFVGQVGRIAAFEKRGENLPPWIMAHSDLVHNSTSVCDPWLWWALGFVNYEVQKTSYFSDPEGMDGGE
jgi:hypothetical protein